MKKFTEKERLSFEYHRGYDSVYRGGEPKMDNMSVNSLGYEEGVNDAIHEREGIASCKPSPRYYLKILENGRFDTSKGNISTMSALVETIVNGKVQKKYEAIKWKIDGPIVIGRRIVSQIPEADGYQASYIIVKITHDTLYLVAEEPEEEASFFEKLAIFFKELFNWIILPSNPA